MKLGNGVGESSKAFGMIKPTRNLFSFHPIHSKMDIKEIVLSLLTYHSTLKPKTFVNAI